MLGSLFHSLKLRYTGGHPELENHEVEVANKEIEVISETEEQVRTTLKDFEDSLRNFKQQLYSLSRQKEIYDAQLQRLAEKENKAPEEINQERLVRKVLLEDVEPVLESFRANIVQQELKVQQLRQKLLLMEAHRKQVEFTAQEIPMTSMSAPKKLEGVTVEADQTTGLLDDVQKEPSSGFPMPGPGFSMDAPQIQTESTGIPTPSTTTSTTTMVPEGDLIAAGVGFPTPGPSFQPTEPATSFQPSGEIGPTFLPCSSSS
jgi:flagellar biosynthesis chaperone FliJ